MLAVIQRVSSSKVSVDGKTVGQIAQGLNILLGVKKGDTTVDIKKLADKILNLRIFKDENEKMNLSLFDIEGEALVISQFTLAGNVKRGRRPSFDESETPDIAHAHYIEFIEYIRGTGINVESGVFGAMMDVEIHNDGPVTFVIDSKEL